MVAGPFSMIMDLVQALRELEARTSLALWSSSNPCSSFGDSTAAARAFERGVIPERGHEFMGRNVTRIISSYPASFRFGSRM